ncbi:hypothetical protein TNCT_153351 [Trichonephila clavata]|uniref:Uncharacterized protein n=1 Tax=Trichonephila clavata TaxID=2740835 RepID=A0A8X6IEU7_TRICU|nr:hypothetical protein TNCT_153351 [Trichonephila clavata]
MKEKEADSFHYQHFRMVAPVKRSNETHERFGAQRDPFKPFELKQGTRVFRSIGLESMLVQYLQHFATEYESFV